MRQIFKITLANLFIYISLSANATPTVHNDDIPLTQTEVAINVTETTLHITGAASKVLYIYNVAGMAVQTCKIDSNDKHIELHLKRGCYIVKIDQYVRKIAIK